MFAPPEHSATATTDSQLLRGVQAPTGISNRELGMCPLLVLGTYLST